MCILDHLKPLIAVALIGGIILILAMFVNIRFAARSEPVEIAVHDEAIFKQLQKKHGKKALDIVVYEADGESYYYQHGEKIYLK